MIEVNVALGYSGSFLIHWKDPADGDTGSEWIHSAVIWDVFKRSCGYHEQVKGAWMKRPHKRSRVMNTVKLEENARGELKELINKLKERIEDGKADRPAQGVHRKTV